MKPTLVVLTTTATTTTTPTTITTKMTGQKIPVWLNNLL